MDILFNDENCLEYKDASKSEGEFIERVCEALPEIGLKAESYKKEKSYAFFRFIKDLDSYLLGDSKIEGRIPGTNTGYFNESEMAAILQQIYAQRYINAHDEDYKEEKIKQNTLSDFISDKYDSGVHFFEEILQNIDDAIGRKNYKKEQIDESKVYITWNDNNVEFRYPDLGFSFYDLMAITSIGNSIKKGNLDEASIGEKGIGFKSIFSVAKKISIKSRFFDFDIEYDTNRKASVLQPSEIRLPGSGKKESVLKIFFDRFKNKGEEGTAFDGNNVFREMLSKWLFGENKEQYLNYSPFLFLKNIQSIVYRDDRAEEKEKTVTIERGELQKASAKYVKIDKYNYIVINHPIEFNKSLIEDRWGKIVDDKNEDFSITRPVEVAFPVVNDENTGNNKKKGLFYSYLPTEMEIDFPIYVNVDVHLKSSRGRISKDDFADGSKWNEHVREELTNVLIESYILITKMYCENKNSAICDENITSIAEKLYLYIKDQSTDHYFMNELKEFYKNIRKEAVFLDITDRFKKPEEVWNPRIQNIDEWNDMVLFCCKKPLPADQQQYYKNYQWHIFGSQQDVNRFNYEGPWKTLLKLFEGVSGFCNYCDENEISKEKRNEILLKAIRTCSMADLGKYEICLVKDNSEKGYAVKSKEQVTSEDKVLFFEPKDGKVEQDEVSLFIAKEEFPDPKQYEEYKEILKGCVDEKNWSAFIGNKLKELEDNCSVYDIFNSVWRYKSLIKKEDIERIKEIDVPGNIKEKFGRYVVPEDFCDLFLKENKSEEWIYRKAIAKYISSKQENDTGYSFFELTDINEDKDKCWSLLYKLGIKNKPDIRIYEDKLSCAIMPGYSSTVTNPTTMWFDYRGDDNYKYLDRPEDVKLLQQYLVRYVNGGSNIDKAKVNELFKEKGMPFERIIFISSEILSSGLNYKNKKVGPKGGDLGIDSFNIRSFLNEAQEDYKYCLGERERLNIDSGKYIFADDKKYPCFASDGNSWSSRWEGICLSVGEKDGFRYSIKDAELIYKIINQELNPTYDIVDKIRWVYIWNRVFKQEYKWSNNLITIEPCVFLKSGKYLLNRSDLIKIIPKGIKIDWTNDTIKVDDPVTLDELAEYIKNEFGVEWRKDEPEKYACYKTKEGIDAIKLTDYEVIKDRGEYEFILSIGEAEKNPKTSFISAVLKTKNILVSDAQRDEIADIVGEYDDVKKKKVISLNSEGSCYDEAIFGDGSFERPYSEIIEENKKSVPSVFLKGKNDRRKKEDWGIKDWLCEPFEFKVGINEYLFQGYGYQCPICGSTALHHSLSGLKYVKRIKNTDTESKEVLPYLYFVCCLNCADMLERADKVKILDYDGGSLLEALEHFKTVCYCADNFHMYNHRKMKTMKIRMTIGDYEFEEDIKVSFFHMLLLLKLKKKL